MIRAVLEGAALPGSDIGTVVMGNVIQAGNKMNRARQAAIGGGMENMDRAPCLLGDGR